MTDVHVIGIKLISGESLISEISNPESLENDSPIVVLNDPVVFSTEHANFVPFEPFAPTRIFEIDKKFIMWANDVPDSLVASYLGAMPKDGTSLVVPEEKKIILNP